jgi:hypothetical protein
MSSSARPQSVGSGVMFTRALFIDGERDRGEPEPDATTIGHHPALVGRLRRGLLSV